MAAELRQYCSAQVAGLSSEYKDGDEVAVGGIITSLRKVTTKTTGQPMAFFTLEDLTGGVIDIVVFLSYMRNRHRLFLKMPLSL